MSVAGETRVYRAGAWQRRGRTSIIGGNPGTSRDTLVLGTYRPGPDTTGVYGGTTFTVVTGDTIYSTAQTVTNTEFQGMVTVAVAGMVFTNCLFRGKPTALIGTSITACVVGTSGDMKGAQFVDCTFTTEGGYNSDYKDSVRGGNYTLRRCEIRGGTDGIGLITAGPYPAIIEQCWIHNGDWATTTTQSDGHTHNDGIQVHRGQGHRIRGNFIGGERIQTPDPNAGDDYNNSCMMIQQEVSSLAVDKIDDIIVEYNWFWGGAACLNISYKFSNDLSGLTVRYNRFLRETWTPATYYMTNNSTVNPTKNNNVFDDTGLTVPNGGAVL